MTWKFNDESELTLDNIDCWLGSVEIRLFIGANLPTMRLSCQVGDDNQQWKLGDTVTGSLSTQSTTYSINGYVYKMQEGTTMIYDVLLRPISYMATIVTDQYDTIQDAISAFESLDPNNKYTDKFDEKVHGYNQYACNMIDRLCQGFTKGIYARGIDKLIIRDLDSSDADFKPELSNLYSNGVITELYNKYSDYQISTNSINDDWTISAFNGSDIVSISDYQQFNENIISNKRYNSGSTLDISIGCLLPIQPGYIIDTSNINSSNNTKIPQRMYVRSAIFRMESSKSSMEVTLAD